MASHTFYIKLAIVLALLKPGTDCKLLNDYAVDDDDVFMGGHGLTDDGEYNDVQTHVVRTDRMAALKQLNAITTIAREEKKNVHALKAEAAKLGSPFYGCSNETYPRSNPGDIPTFTINLDAKPQERWTEVVRAKRDEIKTLADFFEYKFGKTVMTIVDKYLDWLHQTLPQEYLLELEGIAHTSGINIGRVTLYNVFYEFFSVCTSIVMEGEDGKMYHGRNLDFGLFMGWDTRNHTWYIAELLRPLIINLEFTKNGKHLYSAVSYAGYTGILTGLKKNTFSLTIDERFVLDGGYVGLAEWIFGRRDVSWLGLLTRQVMESAESYSQARQLLTDTRLVAPAYFILAGNTSRQGCVVTRGRSDADVLDLRDRWYVLETNYDHWRPTPFYDQRRRYATECMDQLGRQQPLDTLYKVLSTRPVLNKETTLTALMDVTSGALMVWTRDCPDPCWPF